MAKLQEIEIFYAPDRATWRNWLFENYEKSKGIWLVSYKKTPVCLMFSMPIQ